MSEYIQQAHHADIDDLISAKPEEKESSSFIHGQQLTQQQKILLDACVKRREKNQQSVSKAIEYVKTAIPLDPKNAVAYYLLAEAYLDSTNLGHDKDIIHAYEDAIKCNHSFEPAYRELADYYLQQGHYKQAMEAYLRWGKQFPKRGEIWTKIGDIFTILGRTEEAGKFYILGMSCGRKDSIIRSSFTQQEEQDMIICGF